MSQIQCKVNNSQPSVTYTIQCSISYTSYFKKHQLKSCKYMVNFFTIFTAIELLLG
jgi:hypothetical protein